MKTFRKALSVMLCLCMIMSAMAVGLNVFAQEKSEAVERFEANVKAFTGDVGKAEPSAEDLEAYEKLVVEYKALGNSDKESVDVMVFDVFYHHVVMRERQISIKNHPEISSSKKDHYINAAAQAVATLGYVPHISIMPLSLQRLLRTERYLSMTRKPPGKPPITIPALWRAVTARLTALSAVL